MSWSIYAVGLRPAVIEEVTKAKAYGGGVEQERQLEEAKRFIAAEISLMPDTGGYQNGVKVEANGHVDSASRNLQLSVQPIRVCV